ncbi:ankyrin repeat domain protein [Colletotrichum kahawae]|uniref:Ankyrin repeat domain protein n=1 Tax=Colletotrichum kahawae TaxID=34407 RepID=A0AAD9YUA5_COLKA|nr:ankyrin repeat domain protein [Colletotrichum kahawae]
MSLLGLPNELLQAIAVYCGVDGGGLARANRRLHDNTNDILWQSAIRDEDSFTKITARAVQSGNLKTMKKAATYGANFDLIHSFPFPMYFRNTKSLTKIQKASEFWAPPLHLAVFHGHYEIVEWLLAVQNVDTEAPGRLPCFCRGFQDCDSLSTTAAIFHLDQFPIWSPLHFAICHGHISIAYLLLSHKASTCIMFYASVMEDELRLRRRCVGALNHLGVTLNRYRGFTEGMTALHVATKQGSKSLVTYLVQACGVNINEADDSDFRAIYYALLSQDDTMIQHLASLGADLDRHDLIWENAHLTPLIWALSYGRNAAVSKLLDAGAKTWWTRGRRERRAILNHEFNRHYTYPSAHTSIASREQSTEAMRKVMERTLEEHSSEGTRCFEIAHEIWPALKALARMAPHDWNPSTSFSNTAKKILHNVFGDITNPKSTCYLGRSDKQFERLARRWKRDWISGPTEGNSTE